MTTLDRAQPPPFHLSSDYSLAQPETVHLKDGSPFFLFRDLQQDVVKLELIFDAGKWFEHKLGVGHFTAQMLSKGTIKKNSFQIAEALDSLGAHLEIAPGFDTVSISLFALRKNLLTATGIVAELLMEPSFENEELRLMKEIFLQTLKVNNEKTSVIASKEIRKAIFGNEHPYGSAVEEADVKEIEHRDLQLFFNDHFSLRSAFLVGRLSDLELQELIKIIPTEVSTSQKPRTFEIAPGVSHTITKSGSIQSSIRLGKRCLPRSERKDYAEAIMFNHLLGGFFGSRLMKNIREEKGLTYGIYSSMNHFLHEGFWVIGAEVNQQNTGKAIEEIKNEIKKLQEELVPSDELEIAKNYFIGSWQSENSTLFAVAEKIKSIHLWGLPVNYYSRHLEFIQQVTPAQIQRIANDQFDTSNLFEIQVG